MDNVQFSWVRYTVEGVFAGPVNMEVEKGIDVSAEDPAGDGGIGAASEGNLSVESMTVVFVSRRYGCFVVDCDFDWRETRWHCDVGDDVDRAAR